jgi:sec-independent protein translocase protein TatA
MSPGLTGWPRPAGDETLYPACPRAASIAASGVAPRLRDLTFTEAVAMGISGISFWEILLILLVLLLVFGSKRLPGIAADLGSAIRDFRRSVSGEAVSGAPDEPPGIGADQGPKLPPQT